MDGSDYPDVPRDANGRFMPGGPGRRFGAVGKASARVSRAILADFEDHQDELLPRLRRWFMPQYVSLVSRLLTRPIGDGEGGGGRAGGADGAGADGTAEDAAGDAAEGLAEPLAGADPGELARRIAAMRAALAAVEAEAAEAGSAEAEPAAGVAAATVNSGN